MDTLRHEVELRVRDSGAPLKAAPFHSSATLETLPPQTELLIVVLTPYWYGVETEDGHHGWVHRNQLEPLRHEDVCDSTSVVLRIAPIQCALLFVFAELRVPRAGFPDRTHLPRLAITRCRRLYMTFSLIRAESFRYL